MKKFFNNKLLGIILLSIVAETFSIIVIIQAIEIIQVRNKIGVINEVEWYPSKFDNVIITINKKEFKSGDNLVFAIINLSEKIYHTDIPSKLNFSDLMGNGFMPNGYLQTLFGYSSSFAPSWRQFQPRYKAIPCL